MCFVRLKKSCMISIKSKREIEIMREAGAMVAKCHAKIAEAIEVGITTRKLDSIVEDFIVSQGAKPAFKGYHDFPASICASPNEQVVHGIPNDKPLKDGDILSVDIGVEYKGYIGDSAWTYPVGNISNDAKHLLKETEQALWVGLEEIKEGIHLSDVSHAIEKHAIDNNLGIVREMAGHGVGQKLHEEPEILNYGKAGRGPILRAGMTLAIEPMLNLGKDGIKFHNDGWTCTTVDKKLSAHYEHTIVVTENGYEVLTKL